MVGVTDYNLQSYEASRPYLQRFVRIATKPKAKKKWHCHRVLLRKIIHKYYVHKTCIFFQDLLPQVDAI
jgi:hypothetical protein